MMKYWIVEGVEIKDDEMTDELWKLLFEELEEKMEAAANE